MSSSYRKVYVALGAGAALLGIGARAPAANWELLPRLQLGGTYNDNYRMAQGSADKLGVYGPFIDAQLSADLISQTSTLDIVPEVHSTYYPNDTSDQSTDEFLTLNGEHKGQRSDLKGLAHYSNETVINSVLVPATFPGVGLGQTVGGEYGRVSTRNRRQRVELAPEYTYDMTQRAHLDLEGRYDHVNYGNNARSGAIQEIGYQDYSARAGVLFDVTTRSTVKLLGVGSRFQPQLGGHDTNRYGVDFEWDHQASQIMHTYVRLGANRVNANTAVGRVSSNGFTGGAGIEWRYQITEVVLDVLRALSPSAAGAEITDDEVRFRVLHAFQPRLSGYFAARALRLRSASNQAGLTIDGEDYFTTEVGVDYQITMNYRVEGTYDLTWQRFQGESSAASNAVMVSFIYQPLSQYVPLPELTGIPQERY